VAEGDRPPVRVPARFPSNDDLTGRVALVTGAGRGLGRVIANALAERGAAVVACGRTAADLAAVVAEVGARGAEGLAVPTDVRDPAAVQAAVAAALRRFGRLDAVVNNAGVSLRTPVEDVTPAAWEDLLRTNVSGPFFVAQAAARAMMAQGGGTIINVASALGVVGHPLLAAYAVTKGAVVHMTRALAAAWAAHNIRVNAVAPGYIDSPLNAYRKGTPLEQAVLDATPLHRWGQVEDVAAACVFLASAGAAFMTGHVLLVDGGLTVV
jgi:gluconate 5-dehydrogenase